MEKRQESSNLQLQIVQPCHENWDKMSRHEKGRFCSVCSKTVVDFSNSSKEQILQFMSENTGKSVCGNIPSRLLQEETNRRLSYQSKMNLGRFAFALMLVFGTALFGCTRPETQTLGEVLVTENPQDTLSLKDSLQGKVRKDPENTTIGKVKVNRKPE